MSIGPVQLLTWGFDRTDFHTAMAAELERLCKGDAVRVIDALAVYKDAAGRIEVEHLSDLPLAEAISFGSAIGKLIGLEIEGEESFSDDERCGGVRVFSRNDVWDVLEDIPDDYAAVLLLIEHRWAAPLREVVMQAGGFRLGDAFVSPLDLAGIGLGSASEAVRLAQVETADEQWISLRTDRSHAAMAGKEV